MVSIWRALAVAGASLAVFCNTKGTWTDTRGVTYCPANDWIRFAAAVPHDVCIVQRHPAALSQRTNARLNDLWCHDLALRHIDDFEGEVGTSVSFGCGANERLAPVFSAKNAASSPVPLPSSTGSPLASERPPGA